MIDRAEFLIRTGDVRRTDASYRHPVIPAVVVRLPFIDDLVDRVLAVAAPRIVFVFQALADSPTHETYNSGGATVSLGELASLVTEFLPDADINFDNEEGGRAVSGNFMIDNSRLVEEFGVQYAPLRQRVKEVINDIRRDAGLPLVE